MHLPGEFTSHYCLLLLVNQMFKLSFMSLWEKHGSATCGLSLWLYTVWTHENSTHMAFLSLQSINCLRLYIKMTNAGDFSPLHSCKFNTILTTLSNLSLVHHNLYSFTMDHYRSGWSVWILTKQSYGTKVWRLEKKWLATRSGSRLQSDTLSQSKRHDQILIL